MQPVGLILQSHSGALQWHPWQAIWIFFFFLNMNSSVLVFFDITCIVVKSDSTLFFNIRRKREENPQFKSIQESVLTSVRQGITI